MDSANENEKTAEQKAFISEPIRKKMKTKTLEKGRQQVLFGIGLFSAINVLLLVLNILTGLYVFSDQDTTQGDIKWCLPCSDLNHHPDDKLEGIEKIGENKSVCCAKDNENADALVGYFADHWLKANLLREDRRLTQCEDRPKPVIKLVGKTERQTVPHHHRLLWDDEHELVIKNGSINHIADHGLIEIKESGLYQVYSQIVIEHDTSTHQHLHHPSVHTHSIVKIENGVSHTDPNFEMTILKTSNSHCSSKANTLSVTSNLGGTFQLTEGDRLAVKFNNKTELSLKPHMNFFGVHML